MLVKCPVCGEHAPPEVCVELPRAGGVERYCSLRCAEVAEVEAGTPPLPPVLPEAPKRILVAVDGSGPSLRAAELAATLARLSGASVTLLHAVDPRPLRFLPGAKSSRDAELEQSLREEAEAQLRRCRRACESAGVAVATRVVLAAPLRAIADAAADADLVVLGTRGLGAVSGAAVGSLSHRLLGEVRTPLLVVH